MYEDYIYENEGFQVKSLTINVGDKLYYKGIVHRSVGLGFQVATDDNYIETTVSSRYTHPNYQEMEGADEEEIEYCFKAIRSGETEITITHFSDEKDLLIKLDIKDPYMMSETDETLIDY